MHGDPVQAIQALTDGGVDYAIHPPTPLPLAVVTAATARGVLAPRSAPAQAWTLMIVSQSVECW
jgi:hypothetical protein